MNPCSRLQTTNHPFFLKRQEIRKQASRLLLSVNQITVILEACLPFGPVVISKETRWFSFRETVRLDGRKMGENIFATFIRSDESETLGIVKPFYSTSCHYKFPISIKPGFRLYHRLKQKQK